MVTFLPLDYSIFLLLLNTIVASLSLRKSLIEQHLVDHRPPFLFILENFLNLLSLSIQDMYTYIYINYPFHFEEIKDISLEKALDGRTNAKHGERSKNWDRGRCHILPSFTNFTRVVRVHYEIPAGYYAPRLRSQPLDAIPGV